MEANPANDSKSVLAAGTECHALRLSELRAGMSLAIRATLMHSSCFNNTRMISCSLEGSKVLGTGVSQLEGAGFVSSLASNGKHSQHSCLLALGHSTLCLDTPDPKPNHSKCAQIRAPTILNVAVLIVRAPPRSGTHKS